MQERTNPSPALTALPAWQGLPLDTAVLQRRYKRFLADVRLPDGRTETVHCPNSGSMLGMDAPGSRVVVSDSGDPRRRLRRTLELVQVEDGGGRAWVGVNTMRPNAWVAAAITAGALPGIPHDAPLKREVPLHVDGLSGRLDMRLEPVDAPAVWVEVKNTTLAVARPSGVGVDACFPDAVTERGRKHLELLMAVAARGEAAWLVFLVNRGDATRFRPAAHIDPGYAATLARARAAGVQVAALQVRHSVRRLRHRLAVSTRLQARLPQDS